MPLVIGGVLIAVLAGQVVWALVKRQPAARRTIGIAVSIAALGYVVTGYPLLPAQPAPPIPPDTVAVDAFADGHHRWLTTAGDTGAWLTLAEALEGGGRTTDAVEVLQAALAKNPNSPDLWIGLGSALVLHADGAMTPAALMAFDRGETLGSRRPERRNFRLLACARARTICA